MSIHPLSTERDERRHRAGLAVKQAREGQTPPLSQKQLAGRLGFKSSGSYISQIEAGTRSVTYATARAIVSALEMSPADERRFMTECGFPNPKAQEPLQTLLAVIMAEDADNLVLTDFVRADLLMTVHAWRSLVQAQVDLRTGSSPDPEAQFERLERDRGASPLVRLYARRKLAETARRARAMVKANEWLDKALESEDMRTLLATSPYHGAGLRAVLLREQGEVAFQAGDYRGALESLDESERYYHDLPDAPMESPPVAVNRASALLDPSSPAFGAPLLAPDRDGARIIKYQGLGQVAQRRAEALMYLERTEEAKAACEEARGLLDQIRERETPQKKRILRRVNELDAWALARERRYDLAAQGHRAARDEARKAHEVDAEALNWLYLADDLLHLIEDAIEDTAMRAYHDQNPPVILRPRDAWLKALAADPARGAWLDEAEQALREARALQMPGERRARPSAHSVSHCFRGLAHVARLQGRYREASDWLRRAEAHNQASGPARRILVRLRFQHEEQASIYWDQGELDFARRELDLARKVAQNDLEALRSSQPDGVTTTHAPVGAVLQAHIQRLDGKLARVHALDAAPRTGRASGAPQTLDEALDALRKLAVSVIRSIGRVPEVRDVDAERNLDTWLQALKDLEAQPGARALAQDELSMSLASALPDYLRPRSSHAALLDQRKWLFSSRREAFLESVERAQNRRMGPQRNLDICSQPGLFVSMMGDEIAARAREATRLAKQMSRGYAIVATPHSLPFGFAVKGRITLIEAPESFLRAAELPVAEPPTADSDSDMSEMGASLQRERRAGYRFDDKDIAAAFGKRFRDLYQIAQRTMDEEATLRWLSDIAAHNERKPPSGL